MPRTKRTYITGVAYHVLNRSVGRATIFHSAADYRAFVKLLDTTAQATAPGLLAFCVMPNHWHLVVRPDEDGCLSKFLHRLTLAHTMRWHSAHGTRGTGPLYQGRFKSFPIASDEHLLTVCRYVERNPLRAGLVRAAEQWRWSSLWHRLHPGEFRSFTEWPTAKPHDWTEHVNAPQTEAELDALRQSLQKSTPYGPASPSPVTSGKPTQSTHPRPPRPCRTPP